MKAKDLMIEDWVLAQSINGDKYARVACVAIDCCVVSVGDREYEHDYDAVLPIPLTEEILKASGFDPIICCDLSMPKWFMSLRYGNNQVEMPFRYVHELQHALRLCGMNELAENFKIE